MRLPAASITHRLTSQGCCAGDPRLPLTWHVPLSTCIRPRSSSEWCPCACQPLLLICACGQMPGICSTCEACMCFHSTLGCAGAQLARLRCHASGSACRARVQLRREIAQLLSDQHPARQACRCGPGSSSSAGHPLIGSQSQRQVPSLYGKVELPLHAQHLAMRSAMAACWLLVVASRCHPLLQSCSMLHALASHWVGLMVAQAPLTT